jgi:gliding motility-associated-like protein
MKKINLLLLSILSLYNVAVFGQISVTQNSNANALAQQLAGAGVTISNATIVCPTSGGVSFSGTFTNGPLGLGLSDGVLLTTGKVTDVYNASGSTFFSSTSASAAGNPQLNGLLTSLGETYGTNDACVLDFDIEVTGDSIKFNYVMGSEEYPGFVCGGVNDIFGFFISGPNPLGGNYVNQNVALIPGTTIPVSINTVNNGGSGGAATCYDGTYSAFMNPNPAPISAVTSISYNQLTRVLQAKAPTVPCQTYHFKLAIADGGDWIYDSGVFLEAGSFTSNAVVIGASSVLGAGFTEAVEGCVDGIFTLEIDTPYAFPVMVGFNISGTATNGVDYAFVQDSFLMPAGDTIYYLPITVLTDGIIEGTETVILTPYTLCGTLGAPSTLEIVDNYPHTISSSVASLCSPNNVTVTATGAQFYNWTSTTSSLLNPTAASTPTSSPIPQTTTFYVEGTLGTCIWNDSITVNVSTSAPTFHTQPISCPGAHDGKFWVTLNPGANLPFTYSFPFVPTTDSFAVNLGPGFQLASATDANGCVFTSPLTNFTNPAAMVFSHFEQGLSCPNANDGSICLYNIAAGTYTATVDTNGSLFNTYNFTMSSDTFCISALAPATYSISFANDTTGCSASFNATITNPSGLAYSYFSTDALCTGSNDGEISIYGASSGAYTADVVFNGFPIGIYNLNINNDTATIASLAPGAYSVLLTNVNSGCSATFLDTIAEPTALVAAINIVGTGLCAGGSIDSLVAQATGGTSPYQYAWSNGANTSSIAGVAFGTYTVVVTDAHACQDSVSVTTVAPVAMYVSISQDSVVCFNGSSGSAFIDSLSGGTAPYTYLWNDLLAQTNDTASNLNAGNYILTVTDFNNCSVSDTVLVLQPADSISIILNSNLITCFGGDTCIEATVGGAISPYSYLWNDALAQTTEDICGAIAGTYMLTVTDNNGCTNMESITLTQNQAISLVMDSTNILCYGANNGSASVSVIGGSGGFNYLWDDALAQTTAIATNLMPGTYTVIVTDQANSNCSATASVNVVQPSDSLKISLNNLQDVLCNGGNTGAIDVGVTGGTAPYNYTWSNGTIVEDINGVIANNYTLTVTDFNNCTEVFTDVVNQPTALNIILDSTNNVDCFGGNTGAIAISVNGGVQPYSYSWSSGFSTQDISNLVAGTYTITVTDSNACVKIANYTITQPSTVSIGFLYSDYNGVNVSCNGASDGSITAQVIGGSAPYTYDWNNGTSSSNPYSGLAAGAVNIVEVTDNNGCVFTQSALALTEPTLLTVAKDSTNLSCAGYNDGTATAIPSGGTAPCTYIWSDPAAQTTPTASNLAAGTYNCTILDANNCSELIQVVISEPSPIVLNAEVDSAKCWGNTDGQITLTASGGNGSTFEYSIDGGQSYQSGNTFENLTAGNYQELIVRQGGLNGCLSSMISAVVNQPDPMFIFINPEDTTIQIQEQVILSLLVDPATGYYNGGSYSTADITSISWSPANGLSCSDCLNPTALVYDSENEYVATVLYSPYGCETSAEAVINVENNLKFFIPNSFSPQGDGINDVLYVYGEAFKTYYFAVYNRIGEKIFESDVQSKGWDGTYKDKLQNPGVYTYYFKGKYLDDKEVDLKGSITIIR